MSATILHLSVQCSRCKGEKFVPIPTPLSLRDLLPDDYVCFEECATCLGVGRLPVGHPQGVRRRRRTA